MCRLAAAVDAADETDLKDAVLKHAVRTVHQLMTS
jgi:hypothetical protein